MRISVYVGMMMMMMMIGSLKSRQALPHHLESIDIGNPVRILFMLCYADTLTTPKFRLDGDCDTTGPTAERGLKNHSSMLTQAGITRYGWSWGIEYGSRNLNLQDGMFAWPLRD